jgi:sugar-specific transcriptional regulator TrmB
MNLEILERIGLSRAEVSVYAKLLELGSTNSARIVHETGMRKSTVYDSIRRLQAKGLVSHVIKDSKRYFEAADPERLIDFLYEKKKTLDDYENEVNRILPELKKSFSTAKPHAEAHVLLGVEGFKTMRRDVLRNAGKELLLLGGIAIEHDVMPKFYANWSVTRVLKGIHVRVLHKESARKRVASIKKVAGKNYAVRFLPKEFEDPAVINIYGDRVVNMLWKGREPICFMLINKDIADSYRRYFNYLWSRAKT